LRDAPEAKKGMWRRRHLRRKRAIMGYARPIELLGGILYDLECLDRMRARAPSPPLRPPSVSVGDEDTP